LKAAARFLAALALVCVCMATHAAETSPSTSGREIPSADQIWKFMETPGFVVYGNVDDRTLGEVIRRLATLKAVLGRTAAGLDVGSDRAIPVYVFRTHKGFAHYALGRDRTKPISGYFATAYGYRAIAIDLGGEADYSTVYHELVHHVIRRNFGTVPVWFGEGIAVLYESFQCGAKTARIGVVSRGRLAWFETHSMMPVTKLAAVTTDDPDYNETDRAGTFYLQSWLLVHDLLFGNPARGPQLTKYLEAVHSGVSQEAALETCFEGGAAALDRELKAYFAKGYFPYVEVSFDQLSLPEPSAPRTLSRAETLDALGFLALTAAPDETAFARAHFDAALQASPGDPRAIAGLGAVAAAEDRFADAVSHIQAAVAAKAEDPALLLLGGHAMLELEHQALGGKIDLEAPPSPRVLQARAWLEKAIKADPFDDEALVAYAESFLAAGDDATRGVQAFERADRINPLSPAALCELLELHVRRRDRQAAEALYDARIRGLTDADLVRHGADAVLRLDYQDARDAAVAKDYKRALALMSRVRDEARSEQLRAAALWAIPQLEAALAAAPKKMPADPATPKR
jgi:tetratricopeptide (TPR) repeat protein